MLRTLRQQVLSSATLPKPPAVALRLLELLRNDKVDVEYISNVVGRDGALAAKMVRAVNSPFYGVAHRISTLSQAIAMLGLDSAKMLALVQNVL